jgi:acyl dehydratase
VNPDVEGRAYPSTTLVVEAERVGRFASAVGQRPPGVPPTFLTCAEFAVFGTIISDPDLALDFGRVVHGDQEYVWHRPLEVGETLVVAPRIAAIRERAGNGFLTIELEITSPDGEPVATTRATMVERAP